MEMFTETTIVGVALGAVLVLAKIIETLIRKKRGTHSHIAINPDIQRQIRETHEIVMKSDILMTKELEMITRNQESIAQTLAEVARSVEKVVAVADRQTKILEQLEFRVKIEDEVQRRLDSLKIVKD